MNLLFKDFLSGKNSICVIGLGYVGLSLSVLLSKKFKVIGFDIDETKIKELKKGLDKTGELIGEEIKNQDLSFVKSASYLVGRNLKRNSINF